MAGAAPPATTPPPTLPAPPPPPPGPPAPSRPAGDAAALVAPVSTGGGPGPSLPSVEKAGVPAATATAVKTEAQPDELQPQVVKKRPPKIEKTKPTRRLREGDLVCGECGEGNASNRKFCSRCGNSLVTAVAVKRPWWRKLIPRRKPKTLEAGARPGQAGVKAKRKPKLKPVLRRVRQVLSLVLLIGTILYGVHSGFRNAVNKRYTQAKDKVLSVIRPEYTDVNAISVIDNVDPDIPEHEPRKAGDGFNNTYWAVPPGSSDPTLVFTFERPVDLHKMIITPGDTAKFKEKFRPKKLHLVFSNGQSQDITILDESRPQTINIKRAGDVDSVEVHVEELYNPVSNSDAELAITEIEWKTKK